MTWSELKTMLSFGHGYIVVSKSSWSINLEEILSEIDIEINYVRKKI